MPTPEAIPAETLLLMTYNALQSFVATEKKGHLSVARDPLEVKRAWRANALCWPTGPLPRGPRPLLGHCDPIPTPPPFGSTGRPDDPPQTRTELPAIMAVMQRHGLRPAPPAA